MDRSPTTTIELPDSIDAFECDLDELESPEAFLTYFGVPFDPAVVQVNRLDILQRFHDYLGGIDKPPDSAEARFRLYADLLRGAYRDFVGPDARTEKVGVFRMPPTTTIELPDSIDAFECDLDELESAEDFLTYFGVAFDPAVVQVNRLHILQRFHDYLGEIDKPPDSAEARFRLYADLLRGAYRDFVSSDARTEKVFRVFRMHEPQRVNVGLDQLLASRPQTGADPIDPANPR